MSKKIILSYIHEYLKLKVENFHILTRGKIKLFTCPVCKVDPPSCNVIPNSSNLYCFNCNQKLGDLINIVKFLEPDKTNDTEIQILI